MKNPPQNYLYFIYFDIFVVYFRVSKLRTPECIKPALFLNVFLYIKTPLYVVD